MQSRQCMGGIFRGSKAFHAAGGGRRGGVAQKPMVRLMSMVCALARRQCLLGGGGIRVRVCR